jgi:iron complex outermembrane recepter protein
MPAKGESTILGVAPGCSANNKFMTKVFAVIACCIVLANAGFAQKSFNDTTLLQGIEVLAVRAAATAPFAKTNLSKKEIEKTNLGQDLPFLLNQTPSVVVNSDAGTGIGYTGIRIRGTDATRINVTLNGIPYNDAESQGTFLVNLPDFASSAGSIQVQRGVGTSSNGAGAFGASINVSTNEINKNFYAELNNSAGSFNTFKNTFRFGSGLLGKHITIDGRLSRIISDGFIDRAASNLKAAYGSIAYIDSKRSLRLNIFTGKEKTYQAWYGVPGYLLDSNRTFNPAGTEQPGKPYDNETDNYQQTHYQLFYNHSINNNWQWSIAGFFTKGRGYYEQYKADATFASYGLPDYYDGSSTITKTDLVRRLWLDNNFYGSNFSAQYKKNNTELLLGGGWNRYDGKHYGEVIWAKVTGSIPANYHWYDLKAQKTDASLFAKWTEKFSDRWQGFADLQWRNIDYTINGFRNNPGIATGGKFAFINPKLGVTYTHKGWQAYASYARAAHEPNRDDFEAAPAEKPKAEKLNDLELGVEKKGRNYLLAANIYYMQYKDQLVLTGKVNDVGAYTRTNIANSYRTGIELQATFKPAKWVSVNANITLSKNKIKGFTEYIDDYDNGVQKTNRFNTTDIAFSPAVVANAGVSFIPFKNASIGFNGKYVGGQYLDNTGNKDRSLDAFYVQDALVSYTIYNKLFKETTLRIQLNNIFSKKYEPNGYTFSYISGGSLATENYYFPMAPFNFMVGLSVKL